MTGIRALWEATLDMWEELFSIFLYSIIGGLMSLLILPIPFVLAAHYGVAQRIVQARVISWRDWFALGREHWEFFYKWGALVGFTVILIIIDVRFYGNADIPGAQIFQQVLVGLFILWAVMQPFVPAFYFEQEDKSLRMALRNGAVVAFTDPISTVVMWLVAIVLTALVYYLFAWPLVAVVPVYMALMATHIVKMRLAEYQAEEDKKDDTRRNWRQK